MNEKNKISLNDLDKKLPFIAPDGYFEDFPNKMAAQVAEPKVPVRRMMGSWVYMAAMFIGIFLIGNVFYTLYQNNQADKAVFYDTYLLSQIDNVSLIDFYLDEFEDELP